MAIFQKPKFDKTAGESSVLMTDSVVLESYFSKVELGNTALSQRIALL